MTYTQSILKRAKRLLPVITVAAILGFSSAPAAAASRNQAASNDSTQAARTLMARSWLSPRYVALGDSVASGLGLPPAPDATDKDTACGRSPEAYSAQLARRINAATGRFGVQLQYENVSCQGATTDNLTQRQIVEELTVQPQLDQAFAQGTPSLITITLGSNDSHWAEFMSQCFSVAYCDTPENTAALAGHIADMQTKLAAGLQDIKDRSRFLPPLVVVTGYYVPVSTSCVNSIFAPNEYGWIKKGVDSLNNTLQQTAADAGWSVRFAPVDFTGHDICSNDPWVQQPGGANGPAPFHPTARGQQAIADSVLASFNPLRR